MASASRSILRRATGRSFDRCVQSRPEVASTVRRGPVQIVGNNEGTNPPGVRGSLLLSVACRLSAAAVSVAASLGHVAHESGRQHVVESPRPGSPFELLCRNSHDLFASPRLLQDTNILNSRSAPAYGQDTSSMALGSHNGAVRALSSSDTGIRRRSWVGAIALMAKRYSLCALNRVFLTNQDCAASAAICASASNEPATSA